MHLIRDPVLTSLSPNSKSPPILYNYANTLSGWLSLLLFVCNPLSSPSHWSCSPLLPLLFSTLPALVSSLSPFAPLLFVRTLLTALSLSLSLSSHFCTVPCFLVDAFLVDLDCDWPLMIATNHPATQASPHTSPLHQHHHPPPPPRQNPCLLASELAKLTTLRSSLLTPPK